MRAIVVENLGGPERLQERSVPEPAPAEDQVSITVEYAGVTFADVMDRRGWYGHRRDTPFVPGLEVYGTVRKPGGQVGDLRVGEPVVAFTTSGGYGDVAVADRRLVVPVPRAFGHVGGAALAAIPTIFATAHLVLKRLVRPRVGETILVHAAAGGTGGAVAALASRERVRLIGTVGRASKIDVAKSFGYQHAVLRDGFGPRVRELTDGAGVDVVLETVGGHVQSSSFDMLTPTGRLIVMGNTAGFDGLRLTPRSILASNHGVLGFSLTRLARSDPAAVTAAIVDCMSLLADGAISIPGLKVVDRSEAAAVNRLLESGASTGKFVLKMAA